MSDENVILYPAWKQAVQDFIEAGFSPGDVIAHGWLAAHFGMPAVGDAEKLTVTEYQARQFEWLGNIEALKKTLLEQHQICLVSIPGQGWRWVPPHEQTATAIQQFERDARKTFRTAGQRLKHIRIAELSDDQRAENVNAIAKISALRGMTRKSVR